MRHRHFGASRHHHRRQHGRPHEDLRRMDQQIHLPSLRFRRMHRPCHQLPHALQHHAHDGGGVRWLRPCHESLRDCHRREIPLRLLWRRHAHNLTGTSTWQPTPTPLSRQQCRNAARYSPPSFPTTAHPGASCALRQSPTRFS